MKRISTLLLLFISFSCYSQLATWNFNSSNLPASTSATGVTASDATHMGLTSTTSFFTCNSSAWSPSSWNQTETFSPMDDYAEYIITADAGFDLEVTGFTYYARRSSTGPDKASIRSSDDAFGTELLNIAITTSCNAKGGAFAAPITVTSGNSLSIRIYGYSASGTGNMRMDDVTITGTAMATGGSSVGFDAATSMETEADLTFNTSIPVTLSGYGGSQVDLSVTVTGGTAEAGDYTLNTSSLSFTADGTQNISIDINDDADDQDETVELTIAETTSTGITLATSVHTLTITDDDLPMLVINEILADPGASSGDANGDGTINTSEDEFVEIINNDVAPLDISGFTISDAVGVRHTFPSGTILGVGEVLVVFGGGSPCLSVKTQTATAGFLGLNNGGDDVIIKNGAGTTVTSLTYPSGISDQAYARDPDLTGAFVAHTSIAGNPVEYSPGVNNADGSAFSSFDYPIYGLTTDACVTSDVTESTGCGGWQDLILDGQIIASFNDNGEVMGDMTADVYINTAAVRSNNDGIAYMDRNIYITPTTQPTADVNIRLYFTAAELAAFLPASAEASSIADLVTTKTSGVSCSNAFAGNSPTLISPDADMTYDSGHYLEFTVSSFSGFFIHGGPTALPVELTGFKATLLENNTVSLDWTTASELNNAYFEIEKSTNGERFESIGLLEGAGTTTETRNYNFIDNAPSSNNYYRIKQIDFDGTFTYSDVEFIQLSKKDISYSIFPNPVKNQLNLNLGETLEDVTLSVIDIRGQLVLSENRTAEGIQNINTTDLIPGIYFLNVISENGNTTIRFVKE